ncbi:hypothetical protein [Comamonas kerstersii]|uniref:hypothetical protein n=1 Tax=Comamonas kerstersii TaxID=225992 RepID=UPI001416FE5B|nr:hypothetical protein [Comamonas kerstersii]
MRTAKQASAFAKRENLISASAEIEAELVSAEWRSQGLRFHQKRKPDFSQL